MSDANKAVIRRIYDEALNQGRLELADELVDDSFRLHDFVPTPRPTGPEALRTIIRQLHTAFPNDLRFTIEDLVAEGDKVVVRWTQRGTHEGEYFGGIPATGLKIEQQAIVIYRVADGKVTDLWSLVGQVDAVQQLREAANAAA
ncbi:ester cyclase [Flindersiella endophytica]